MSQVTSLLLLLLTTTTTDTNMAEVG